MGDLTVEQKRDMKRREIFVKNVPDFAKLKGLEIGALCSPLVTKKESQIKYYDILPKEQLIKNFQAFYPGKTFVDVDFVADTKPLSEVLGDWKFDYFIANHVIEHIPDFIGFFKTVHEHLNPGGKFFLAVPDRRFTFDYKRPETTAGHLIVDYEDYCSVDTAEHILDALIYHTEELNVYWSDIEYQRYHFVHHHHIFNFENFIDMIIRPLMRMGYFPFSVIDLRQESDMDNEFIIVLEKNDNPKQIHILGEKVKIQPPKEAPAVDIFDFRVQMKEIVQSGLFDALWYQTTYPAVLNSGLDPLRHYYFWGAYRGFNPSEGFDSQFYLDKNPDVKGAGYNPLWHYVHCGKNEGRQAVPEKKAN